MAARVILWKPFDRCFSKIRRNWSATDSIVHAYATLFLLPFSILNHNVYLLLESTNVYNSTGKVKTNVLVKRPSIHMYSSEYIPYLIIVLTLMFFLGVCPTALLCIYSIKMLRRKFNNGCSHRIQIALNTFVETFQGTFKDGLNGTRDYRVSPALLLIIVMCCLTLGTLGNVIDFYLMPSFMVLFVVSSFVVTFARPCKSFLTNLSLSFHMMWTATLAVMVSYVIDSITIRTSFLAILFAVTLPVPHALIISWAIYKLLHNIQSMKQSVAVFKTGVASLLGERVLGTQQSLLPD